MSDPTPKTRIPKQQRSIDKKNRIMHAAMTLFAQKGIHGTNSKEIAKNAGVAIGSFYSYFPDKQKLLTDVLEIYLNDHYNRIWTDRSVTDPEPSPLLVRHYMENLLAAYNVAPGFHRETHVLRYSDPDVKALYDKEAEREITRIVSVLSQFKDVMAVKDMEAAAVVIHSAAENLAHKIKFMGSLNEERLVDEFTEMIFKYLSVGGT